MRDFLESASGGNFGTDQFHNNASDPVKPPDVGNARVLVIECEAAVRRQLRGCLARNAYRVVEATTGNEGIRQVVRVRPKAVLLDMELPDVEGIAVLRRLRELTEAPIIVVSKSNKEADKVRALDNGARDYLTKP